MLAMLVSLLLLPCATSRLESLPIFKDRFPPRNTPRTSTTASCVVEPYTAPAFEDVFPPFNDEQATIYRYRQQFAVNLGSWFVNENWMTPSLFTCASGPQLSEIDIATGWGSVESAKSLLERHWDTFITKEDMSYLASIGINTVRLPVGFWHLGPKFCIGTAFANVSTVYENAWSRIVRTINMAAESGIGVLVDLHGAVGSQNGQPHSGVSDGVAGLFSSASNVEKTLAALSFLVQQLKSVTNVVGVQILNEPVYDPTLEAFYGRALDVLRAYSADMPLYMHNGFDCARMRQFMMSRSDFVVEDHHSYFVFTPSDADKPASAHTVSISTDVASKLRDNFKGVNAIIGEWSCALTPQSLSSEADDQEARHQFCSIQESVYTNITAGWHFWSYKKETCQDDPGWCFLTAVGRGLPATFFAYAEKTRSRRLITPGEIEALLPTSLPGTRDPSQVYLHSRQYISHRFLSIWRRQANDISAFHQGYSEGLSTAKLFARHELSKLGFVEQYMRDRCHGLPGSEAELEQYKQGFRHGLVDGETLISAYLSAN